MATRASKTAGPGRAVGLRAAIGSLTCALALLTPTSSEAGQTGGSILYEDQDAVSQELEFKAFVWRVPDDYFKAVVRYRPVGSDRWRGLEKNWCWTRRCALEELIVQARFLARDGYIWRFQNPTGVPARAARYRFREASFRNGTEACAARLIEQRRKGRARAPVAP